MESDKMESRMAEREAQRDKERGPLFLLPPIPRMAERRAQLEKEIWRDFDSDVSDDEDFNKLLKNLMAEREAQSSGFCVFFWDYTYRSPPRRVEFSLSEKKRIVSAVDDWISSLDDPVLFTRMAVRRAQLVMERWVDFGSDVSAVEDFNKLLDDLMAVRRAQRYMQRRGDCSLSEKKRIVSAVDNWINSLDDQMATGSLESNDSGVSLKSDRSKAGWIDFKDRVSPRPDFSSSEEEDVSDDEDLVQSRDAQREDDILPYMCPWSDDCDWMELADNLRT